MIVNYWKIMYVICNSCLPGVRRLRSHFFFCTTHNSLHSTLTWQEVVGFTMLFVAPLVLTMNVWWNPLGLDVPQSHSKCSLLGFCSPLPLSHSCYFKKSHWFSPGCCAFSYTASPPALGTEPALGPPWQRQNVATTFNGTLLEPWGNGWEFQQ